MIFLSHLGPFPLQSRLFFSLCLLFCSQSSYFFLSFNDDSVLVIDRPDSLSILRNGQGFDLFGFDHPIVKEFLEHESDFGFLLFLSGDLG